MARRSKVIIEASKEVSVEASVEASTKDGKLNTDPFWEQVKMADFRFAMRQFNNGAENGTVISWRGLVHQLLTLSNEASNKQVFITIFESDGKDYSITLRLRIVLSENGIGYSLCRALEALQNKTPQGVFVRIDVRDTISVSETLTLLRERFPNKA